MSSLRKTRLIIKACQDGEMERWMTWHMLAANQLLQEDLNYHKINIHSSCFESIAPFLFTNRKCQKVSFLFFVKSNCFSFIMYPLYPHVSTVDPGSHLPSLAAQCCAMTTWWTRSQMSRILRGEELIVACRDHVHAAVLRTHWHQRNPQWKSM